jgi:hypothetical protein
MEFRPCIDIHDGHVKQIVGGALDEEHSHVKENYPSSSEDIIEINPYGSEDTIDVGALDSDALSAIDTSCGATYGATLVKNMVSAALDEAKGVA